MNKKNNINNKINYISQGMMYGTCFGCSGMALFMAFRLPVYGIICISLGLSLGYAIGNMLELKNKNKK